MFRSESESALSFGAYLGGAIGHPFWPKAETRPIPSHFKTNVMLIALKKFYLLSDKAGVFINIDIIILINDLVLSNDYEFIIMSH